jgi:TolB-like protein
MWQPAPEFRRPGSPIAVALLAAALAAAAPAAIQARPGKAKTAAGKTKKADKGAARAPKITPHQEGKIVVFPFKDDDDNSLSAQVERLFRAHGLEVVAGVRPVDTAEQYREMAGTLNIAAYIEGSLKESETNAKVTIQLRSGYTGKKVTAVTFKETKLHIRAEIEEKLWSKFGPAMARACTDATKPRKRGRGPLVIEAGTPIAASDQ